MLSKHFCHLCTAPVAIKPQQFHLLSNVERKSSQHFANNWPFSSVVAAQFLGPIKASERDLKRMSNPVRHSPVKVIRSVWQENKVNRAAFVEPRLLVLSIAAAQCSCGQQKENKRET